MERAEYKTTFPVSVDPSRLRPSIFGISTSALKTDYTFKSPLVDGLLKKHSGLLNSTRIASLCSGKPTATSFFPSSKRGGLSQKGVPPEKKVKKVESIQCLSKQPQGVYTRTRSKRTEPVEDVIEDVLYEKPREVEKMFTEVNYESSFEKMEVDDDWECDFGMLLEDEISVPDAHFASKKRLLDLVNVSLVEVPNFRRKDCKFRPILIRLADSVAEKDPEFILKVSLYSRRHLNIRTTSNFLVAYAAMHATCKLYLSKYYSSIVVLPSDWIEIAEFALTFCEDGRIVFPSSLRRVMVVKFKDFDKYQLGKYNKDKNKNKKRREKRKAKAAQAICKNSKSSSKKKMIIKPSGKGSTFSKGTSPEGTSSSHNDADREFNILRFTIKQLVRKLHISEPVDHVMSLVGKKYPSNMEQFFASKLPGLFEEERAGKRMKLPVPETWETQISLKGNKAKVWEELIDGKKLPFMAMLRNLRNLIKANVSGKHHNWVRGRLTNENAVINSKQFPFRFFSAYEELKKLTEEKPQPYRLKVIKKLKGKKTSKISPKKISSDLIDTVEKYRTALDRAVSIATRYNIPPMPGHSIVFCDFSEPNVNHRNCSSARGLGECKTVAKIASLLCLMCKHSCEESHLFVCGTRSMEEVGLAQTGTILKNAQDICELESILTKLCPEPAEIQKYVSNYVEKLIYSKTKINRWIIIGGGKSELATILAKKMDEYRESVNPDVQGFQVNLAPEKAGSILNGFDDNQKSAGLIHLFGFTEQTLRFMVESGDRCQITFVENIDRLHKLEDSKHLKKIKESKPCLPDVDIPPAPKIPRWSNCRIFISSTFLDMFSERDLLVKYIFQELKARARSLHVNIFEVDLRWGISEEQSQNRETIHLCLSEVTKCQFFLGILGERYGWCPDDYGGIEVNPGMEWIGKHPPGASLTELEFHQCFKSLDVKKQAFFYFRDPEFIKDVPKKHRHFVADDNEQRLKSLKRFVINSGAEVYDRYPCCWGGLDEDGKARVVDLESFGRRVLDNLWNAIEKMYATNEDEADESRDDDSAQWTAEKNLHLSYVDFLDSRFAGRQNLVNAVVALINSRRTGLVLLTGKPGSGKSAVMASACKHWMDFAESKKVLLHCVGASPGSENISRALFRLVAEMEVVPMPPAYWETGTFDLACKLFLESLKILSNKNIPVQVFIDGVDYLSNEHNARLMTWLPLTIPQNVLFVVSTNENSVSHNALRGRPSLVGSLDVGPLSLPDKQAVIRETLKSYSKTLDESAFNNQMRMITSKSESSSPLYLSLICEEMRQFGDFERVNSKLASLPSTLSALMQDMIQNLEKSHGVEFTRATLCCLAVSKEGLKEYELQDLLSRALAVQRSYAGGFREVAGCVVPPEELVGSSSVLFFLRGARHLLRASDGQESGDVVMSIGYSGIKEAIRQRFMSTMEGKKYEKFIHTLLASYFYRCLDPNLDKNFKPVDRRVLSSLTYHLVNSSDYQIIFELLTDLSFIEFEFILKLNKELFEAYQVPAPTNSSLRKNYDSLILSKKFKDYQSFVFKNAHLLSRHPQLTVQQALLEADDSCVCLDCNELLMVRRPRIPYARWLNKDHHQDLCIQSIAAQGSSCVALSSDDNLLAVGFESAIIKIYKTTNYEVMHGLIGHSASVTSICFVSNNRICSASRDGTLSLWDVIGGYRLCVMEGHGREVTTCVSDPVGRIVVSAGLDAVVNVWHGVTGSLETNLPRDGCPINCLSLHPEGQLVVTGGWDSSLKIWDVVQKDKRATLRGHRGSIRDVKFNRSGVHVASVDIFGEVRIWSAQHGCTVGFLRSQPHLTTRVFYSGNELLLSTSNGTVRVLSGTMGRCINLFGESNHGPATCMAFDQSPETPLPDVVVGYHSGSVRMFSCSSGNQVWEQIHQGSPVAVSSISFHCDDTRKYVLVGKADGICLVLTAENGKTFCSLTGLVDPVCGVVSTKEYLVTAGGCSLNVHRVYEIAKGGSHMPTFIGEEHKGAVTGVSVNHTGDMLASVGRDRAIIVWSFEGPLKVLSRFDEAHRDWITCCSWSNSTDFLVTGSNDFTVKIWDVRKEALKHTLVGHDAMITNVSFKHGCIVSSSADGFLKVWSHKGVFLSSLVGPHVKCNSCDLFASIDDPKVDKEKSPKSVWANPSDTEILKEARGSLEKQQSTVRAVIVASCYDDGTVRIWSPNEADERFLLVGHKREVTAVASSNHGLVVSSSADGFLKVWRVPSIRGRTAGPTADQSSAVSCLASSPDGRVICAATGGGFIKAWTASDVNGPGDVLLRPQFSARVGFGRVNCLHFLSSNLLVASDDDCGLSLWQIQNRNGLNMTLMKTKSCDLPITSLVSSKAQKRQDSYHLITFHFQASVRLWIVSLDKKVDILEICERPLSGLQFFGAHVHHNESSIFSYLSTPKEFGIYNIRVAGEDYATDEFQLKLRALRTNYRIPSPVASSFTRGPPGGSADVVYHGTLDGRLFAWKKDETDPPCYDAYRLHRDQITGLVFIDDIIIITSSLDGRVKLFDVKSRRVVGEFTTPFRISSMIELRDQTGPPRTHGVLCGTECGTMVSVQWNFVLP